MTNQPERVNAYGAPVLHVLRKKRNESEGERSSSEEGKKRTSRRGKN